MLCFMLQAAVTSCLALSVSGGSPVTSESLCSDTLGEHACSFSLVIWKSEPRPLQKRVSGEQLVLQPPCNSPW